MFTENTFDSVDDFMSPDYEDENEGAEMNADDDE